MRSALVTGATCAVLAVLAASAGAATRIAQTSCLWTDRGAARLDTDPAKNYAFPDTGAVYWSAKFTMPPGSRLVLRGRFAHARYQSLNSYADATNAPIDALDDVGTRPDHGSVNPYVAGMRRDRARRSYTVTVLDRPPPGERPANTLYAGAPGETVQELIYRVYVPDSFTRRDLTGGVGLPKPRLRLADGSVQTGRRACRTLRVVSGQLSLTTLPRALYESLRNPPGVPPTFPAEPTPAFRSYYNTAFAIACGYQGQCSGSPVRTGGQYSNVDNTYVSALVSRGFPAGPVLVLRGRMPTTPRTGRSVRRMRTGQLRYWSMCQNESLYTTRGAGCVYDDEVPLDRHRRYTIVTSRRADRPRNARRRCGVAFIPWPAAGDGDGNRDDGLLLVRNMLPAPGFRRAVQRTRTPGDERAVLGPYYPRGTYTTTAAFEKRGCGGDRSR